MNIHQVNHYDDLPRISSGSLHAIYSDLGKGSCGGSHSMLSLKMVFTGEEQYRVGHRNFKLQPGQFLLTPADTEVQGTITSHARGLCVFVSKEHIANTLTASDDLLSSVSIEQLEHFQAVDFNGQASEIAALLTSMSLEQLMLPDSDQLVVEALAEQFGYFAHIDTKLYGLKPTTRNELTRRLERAKAYLLAHRDSHIQLADVAQVANLSRFHLNRIFKQVYGEPPLRFHQNCRLDWALEQLIHGKSTSQVSDLLNFATVTSFSRAFVRRHGFRPSVVSP